MSRLRYHELRVARVVEETADARSVEFELPEALREAFRYKPGQHLQLHVPCGGKALPRCYSLSSTPLRDEPLRVTVKRVVDGRASHWLCGTLAAGDMLEVAPPAGVFTPRSLDGELLLFAGGSGITPVFSIVRSVLAAGRGRMRLVYANRDERSVIFGAELAKLAREHPQRLEVVHWLDSVQGTPSASQLGALARGWEAAEAFICGPTPFMDAATAALRDAAFPSARVHVERFVSLPEDADDAPPVPRPDAGAAMLAIDVELDGVRSTVPARDGEIVIEALEAAGLAPPFSCRAGACAACMCRLEDGEVELVHNHVLGEDEIAQGWILACQAVARSDLRLRYPS